MASAALDGVGCLLQLGPCSVPTRPLEASCGIMTFAALRGETTRGTFDEPRIGEEVQAGVVDCTGVGGGAANCDEDNRGGAGKQWSVSGVDLTKPCMEVILELISSW